MPGADRRTEADGQELLTTLTVRMRTKGTAKFGASVCPVVGSAWLKASFDLMAPSMQFYVMLSNNYRLGKKIA
jgi:hypothetical protein